MYFWIFPKQQFPAQFHKIGWNYSHSLILAAILHDTLRKINLNAYVFKHMQIALKTRISSLPVFRVTYLMKCYKERPARIPQGLD